jgi:hypothetical protein
MARGFWNKLGTWMIGIGLLVGVPLVLWNLFGQSRYGGTCSYSLGCRSFYCVHHELVGSAQSTAPDGMCTKACDADSDCGSGAACVVLGDDALGDLPPLGKPDRACLHVRP